MLDWSSVAAVHIRPTFFSEWLTFPWVRDPIADEGKITLPYGNGRHAPISGEDQARFIAAVLTNPSNHVGKTYILSGPVELSQAEIAQKMSQVLGRTIRYAPISLEAYKDHLKKYKLPEFLIQHFLEVAVDYQNGIFAGEDDIIKKVTGQAPQTVEEFVSANRKAFDPKGHAA